MSTTATTMYLALDIEKAGPMPLKHPVISIGWCGGDEKGNVIIKGRINLQVKWPTGNNCGDFDEKCWLEFWNKLPVETISLLQKDALPQKEGFQKFADMIDYLEKSYKIKFVSDNAAFDIGTLNVYLEKYTGRLPLAYTSDGRYRRTYAADDMLEMIPDNNKLTEKISVIHDHDPQNDAEFIYRMMVIVLQHRLK